MRLGVMAGGVWGWVLASGSDTFLFGCQGICSWTAPTDTPDTPDSYKREQGVSLLRVVSGVSGGSCCSCLQAAATRCSPSPSTSAIVVGSAERSSSPPSCPSCVASAAPDPPTRTILHDGGGAQAARVRARLALAHRGGVAAARGQPHAIMAIVLMLTAGPRYVPSRTHDLPLL